MAAAGPRVVGLDWRTSIAAARKRLGDDVAIQGNLDPALVLAGPDVALAGAARRARRQRRANRDTSSTSATACTRPAIPGVLAAIVDHVHEATRASVNRRLRRRRDGVRHATPARGHRRLLHGHPARAAAERRAARRPHPALRRDRRAQPAASSAPRRSGRCSPSSSRTRHPASSSSRVGLRHAEPSIEAAVDALADDGRRRDRRPRAGAALLDDVGGRLPRTSRRGGQRRAAAVHRDRELGDRAGVRRSARRRRRRIAAPRCRRRTRVLFTAHSLPRRILDTADPYPSEVAATATARRRARLASPPTAGRSPGSRPDGRRNRGSSRTCSA